MAPRMSNQLLPTHRVSDLEEEEVLFDCPHHPEELDENEPVALHVMRGRRRVLETVVDHGSTLKDLKEQIKSVTKIPGDRMVICSKGCPLGHGQLRGCLRGSTVTLREAEPAWVQTLEENLGDLKKLQAQGEEALKETQSLIHALRQHAADLIGKFKEATSSFVGSANHLEDAAERLQRNRSVIFEVAPRGSKGARRAAEDLMHCRNGLLEATQANGTLLKARGAALSVAHESFMARLQEMRPVLARASELLLRQTELLQLQRYSGSLRQGTVETKLARCEEQLLALREHDLQTLSQDVLACRRNYKLAMRSNLLAIKRASDYLQQDEKVVLTWALGHVSKGRASDRDFMLAVVQSNGEALEEAPVELQQDREVVLEALRSSKGWALQFAADELKRDREIVLTAVRRSGLCLEFAAPEMRADRDVVLAAVQVQGEALEFASEALRGDPLVVAEAIRSSCGWALQYAAEEMRGNPVVVLSALSENGLMLEHLTEKLRGDAEIALRAVSSNPAALQFASEELRGNKKLVMAAVAKDGFSLRFAADSMKADRDVVLAALRQAGEYVLVLAPESLRSEPRIADMVKKLQDGHSSRPSEGVADVSWAETGLEKANL